MIPRDQEPLGHVGSRKGQRELVALKRNKVAGVKHLTSLPGQTA
jgi:hypothetical protein